MEIWLTTQSVVWLKRADRLFVEWQAELPSGPLREHIAKLSEMHHSIDSSKGAVYVLADGDSPVALFGTVELDGQWEVIGPYVVPEARRKGYGTFIMAQVLCSALASSDIIVLAPADALWTVQKLQALGLDPVASRLADAAGDHKAFSCNLITRAADRLSTIGEPRGGGRWQVSLHNDDVTPFDFVTETLARLLDLQRDMAACYASLVHHHGTAVIRYCRTERGARKMAEYIMRVAAWDHYPLKASYSLRSR
jgi:ATP-dependent Clp protease adapter protein ClpS